MEVRRLRDGSWRIGGKNFKADWVPFSVPAGVSFFDADTVTGVVRAFAERGGEVHQIDAEECIQIARGIVYALPDIEAARDSEAGKAKTLEEQMKENIDAMMEGKPAIQKRSLRYNMEADPLLLAVIGYQIEQEADPKAATAAKLAKAKGDYLAAKAKIRAEVPDAVAEVK
jgi:hypothetical protein